MEKALHSQSMASTAASSKALGKKKKSFGKKTTPPENYLPDKSMRAPLLLLQGHHICCCICLHCKSSQEVSGMKVLQTWGKKVLRTRHAIVRSREKRQIVKVKDYINDFNGQKYQAEEVSRTDRI